MGRWWGFPYYNKPPRTASNHSRAIATRAQPCPVMLYNIARSEPACSRRRKTAARLNGPARNVVSLKAAIAAPTEVSRLRSKLRLPSGGLQR